MPRQPTRDDDFAAWMAARQPALQRTAYLLAGDHHTAEDLVATTLARVYLAWDRIDHRGAVDGYARRVLVNESSSLWRRAWRKREVTSSAVPDWIEHQDHLDDGSVAEAWRLLATLPPWPDSTHTGEAAPSRDGEPAWIEIRDARTGELAAKVTAIGDSDTSHILSVAWEDDRHFLVNALHDGRWMLLRGDLDRHLEIVQGPVDRPDARNPYESPYVIAR